MKKISVFLEAAKQMSAEKNIPIPASMSWPQVLKNALKKIDLDQMKTRGFDVESKKRRMARYTGMRDTDEPIPEKKQKTGADVIGGDSMEMPPVPNTIPGQEDEKEEESDD
jgi:hypothetical protein